MVHTDDTQSQGRVSQQVYLQYTTGLPLLLVAKYQERARERESERARERKKERCEQWAGVPDSAASPCQRLAVRAHWAPS